MSDFIIFKTRIVSGRDDVEQAVSDSMYVNSSDQGLVTDGSNVQTAGLRFSGVSIPQGASSLAAYTQFQPDKAGANQGTLAISGWRGDHVRVDDDKDLADGADCVMPRALASASVLWSPAAWTLVGEVGPDQRTSHLTDIVQEIVSRHGWAVYDAMG